MNVNKNFFYKFILIKYLNLRHISKNIGEERSNKLLAEEIFANSGLILKVHF